MDIYDAAAFSAITSLSEQLIERGNETVGFPNFTERQMDGPEAGFCLNR